MDRQKLIISLMKEEGLVLTPYYDSEGYGTIGIGHAIQEGENFSAGITKAQALDLLNSDLDKTMAEISSTFPWFTNLNEVRQRVIADMAFNLGVQGVCEFRAMILAIESQDWSTASADMLESLWAREVGKRAQTLATMMETGEDICPASESSSSS